MVASDDLPIVMNVHGHYGIWTMIGTYWWNSEPVEFRIFSSTSFGNQSITSFITQTFHFFDNVGRMMRTDHVPWCVGWLRQYDGILNIIRPISAVFRTQFRLPGYIDYFQRTRAMRMKRWTRCSAYRISRNVHTSMRDSPDVLPCNRLQEMTADASSVAFNLNAFAIASEYWYQYKRMLPRLVIGLSAMSRLLSGWLSRSGWTQHGYAGTHHVHRMGMCRQVFKL